MVMGPDPGAQVAADAAGAKKSGITALVVGFCCCPPAGIVLGYLAMNKANAVLQTIAQTGMGQQFMGDATTGKTLGIVAMVLGVIQTIGGVIGGIVNVAAMSQQ